MQVGIYDPWHQWSWPWPWTQTECYNAYISIMLYKTCITFPLLYYINKLVTSQNVDATKVNQKSMTLTLILNTNYECHKAYIRLLQLFDIKLMKKTLRWHVRHCCITSYGTFLKKINDLQNQGHVTPKSNFPSWNHGKSYSTMLPVSNDTKFMLVTRNANDFTSKT